MTNPQNNDYVSPSDEELEAMIKGMLSEVFGDDPEWTADKEQAKREFPEEDPDRYDDNCWWMTVIGCDEAGDNESHMLEFDCKEKAMSFKRMIARSCDDIRIGSYGPLID